MSYSTLSSVSHPSLFVSSSCAVRALSEAPPLFHDTLWLHLVQSGFLFPFRCPYLALLSIAALLLAVDCCLLFQITPPLFLWFLHPWIEWQDHLLKVPAFWKTNIPPPLIWHALGQHKKLTLHRLLHQQFWIIYNFCIYLRFQCVDNNKELRLWWYHATHCFGMLLALLANYICLWWIYYYVCMEMFREKIKYD